MKGLAFINSLRPVTYTVDINGLNDYLTKEREHDGAYEKTKADLQPLADEASAIVYNGFIAQDVEAAAKRVNYEFSGVDKPKTKDGLYGLRYADFVVPLVKAVQELSKQNDSLKESNDIQHKINHDLESRLAKLEAMMNASKPVMDELLLTNTQLSSVNSQWSSASLSQNIPNPFNHTTTIHYLLPEKFASAQIVITDRIGNTIKTINVSGTGNGNLTVDASTLASGAYNYSLFISGKMVGSKQMILAK